MYFIIKFWWIYWIFESINIVLAFPIKQTETNRDGIEKLPYQFQYVVTSGAGLLLLIFCIIGCMCCKKQRNLSKGFEIFNNGSTADSEHGLELEAPRFKSDNKLQLKSLSVDNFVNDIKIINKSKPPILLHDGDDNNIEYDEKLTINEWLDSDLHVSRDCLKYLCEIGRGWFGKVVEGTQIIKSTNNIVNNEDNNNPKSVIVRILTEEASTNEKSWFLNESLSYLKLKHKNILSLYGICIENDPYLLIFESCQIGDLKSFLIKNNNSNDLIDNNVILKMTIDITVALDYMHKNDFSHTDLSTRNCLVTNNLTIKLGDYGISVDKYPNDYYVVDDRALPIRWSAPESIICTDTTIVTRSITQKANIWSYSILLWEIINWGKRPYDDLCDDKVIEMILLNKYHDNLIIDNNNTSKFKCLIDAMKLCWKYLPNERATLDDIHKILHDNINDNFDERWSILGNNFKELGRCTSLNELRKYNDDDDDDDDNNIIINNELKISSSSSSILNTNQQRAIFKLGPDELIINNNQLSNESGSETEEESWRGRVERGVYTEKVKQKSKSVADLMILTHIDSDSDVELSSMASQINDKIGKKKLTTAGSVDDLRFTKLNTTKFNAELKKLRNPLNNEIISKEKLDNINNKFTSTPNKINNYNNNINDELKNNYVDVELWNNAIEYELDNKIPGFDVETITFDANLIVNNDKKNIIKTTTPDTPQSHDVDDAIDDTEKGNTITICDEEERKNLSTPDDERSSDSGFRDKESCEDEDNQITTIIESLSYNSLPATSNSNSTTEEEQLKILYELDCILDAECSGNYEDNNYQLIKKGSSSNIEFNNDIQSSQLSSDNDDNNQSIIEIINNIDDAKFSDNKLINNTDNCTNNIINNSNNNNDDDESSTISLKSDNSYVSFHLDDEFVAAIRNELREKLPHAQMSIVEAPELHDDDDDDEKNTSINENITPTSAWIYDDDENENNDETKNCDFRKNIDIAIRYNIYGTALSPIMEERESTVTSDALLSKDNSNDLSDASKLSNLPDDEIIMIDTKTNKFLLIDDDDDRDSTNGDLSDDENMDYIVENNHVKYKLSNDNNFLNCGVPLPSPEEESKWHSKFKIPLANQQDVVMSTSFSTDHDWNSQDEDDEDDEDENTRDKHTDDDDDEDDDEEENSSSSGEFVWKPYDEKTADKNDSKEIINTNELNNIKEKIDEEDADDGDDDDDDDEEEEFTPSAWDATLAPHRSALRSPEKKNIKTGDQKKNVWFKKQRYHCVYEYPKEIPVSDCQGQAGTTWEPTSYADWEEMMDEPKLDVYPIDYDDSNFTGDEEFSVSSGSRPFQFNAGNGKYVSQFFPGASTDTTYEKTELNTDNIQTNNQQQNQLGELRHTRNKLKLNLSINNDNPINSTTINVSDDSDNDNTTNFEMNNSSESSKEDSGSNLVSIERSSIESSSELSCNDDLNSKNNNIGINNTSKSSGRPLSIQNNNNVDDNITSMTHEHHKDDNKITDINENDTVKLSNDESNIINDLTLPNKLNNESNDLHKILQ